MCLDKCNSRERGPPAEYEKSFHAYRSILGSSVHTPSTPPCFIHLPLLSIPPVARCSFISPLVPDQERHRFSSLSQNLHPPVVCDDAFATQRTYAREVFRRELSHGMNFTSCSHVKRRSRATHGEGTGARTKTYYRMR